MKQVNEYIEINKSMLRLIIARSEELELSRDFYKKLLSRMIIELIEIQQMINQAEMDRVFIPPPEEEHHHHGKN